MRQTAIALALLLLFAFPCYGAEQEAAEYTGFSQTAENFPFLSVWPSAPETVVRKALPLASEVHLTCTAPRAFAVRFGFYASSPLFCSPTRQGDSLVPGVSRDSCAVLGSYLDTGLCLPLRYSPQSDSLWAEYEGSWYQLCWNRGTFQYEMQRQETGPLPDSLCQGLVQLSVSQDGERFTETEYRIVDIKSQSLENRNPEGGGDFCYYLCEAKLPAQTGFVRISVKDCRSYPLSGGGSQVNANPNAVYLGQVTIECEKAPDPEPGGEKEPGGEENPGGETKPGEEGKPDDGEDPGGEEKPGEPEKPDDGQDPTDPEPPGDEGKPGGEGQPGGEGKPGGEDKPGGSTSDDTPPAPPDSGETPVTPAPSEKPSAPGQPDISSPGSTRPWEPENPEEEPLPASETPKSLRLHRETAGEVGQETEAPAENEPSPAAAPPLSASLQEPAPIQSEPQAVQDQVIIEYRERPTESRSGEQSSASPQSADRTPAGYGGGNHIFYQKASGSSGMSVSSVLLAAGLGVQLHVVASRLSSRRREDAPAASDREPPEQ